MANMNYQIKKVDKKTCKQRYLKIYNKKLHTLWPTLPYPKGANTEY